jgi:cytochrome c peroxidase
MPGPARLILLALAALTAACGDEGAPAPEPLLLVTTPEGFAPGPLADRAPAENPLDEARAQLGRRLFHDVRLSRTNEIACASCHQQTRGFAEGRAVSTGVEGRRGKRNAPALINLAWAESLFWDGRVRTLEEQVTRPIEDAAEMDLPLAQAVARLGADSSYVAAFTAAFGGPPSELHLRHALASFVRTLVSGQSPYDRFLRGDESALSPAARRGEAVFAGEKGGCFHCHPQKVLTNEGFFNNGTYQEGADPGRQGLTGRAGDLGKFKVPGLRNVAVTAPYMHDGSLATLEDVIEQYSKGGRGHPSTDPQIAPLTLTAEQKADLLAFLNALTDERFLADRRYAKP